MSEALKPEMQDRPISINDKEVMIQCRWDSSVDDWVITEHGHETITRLKIEKLERDRNRWRSVAEQAEKALKGAEKCMGEYVYGETHVAIKKALSAFDSLRKEEKEPMRKYRVTFAGFVNKKPGLTVSCKGIEVTVSDISMSAARIQAVDHASQSGINSPVISVVEVKP
jgi:hypothetical protein